MGRRRLAPALAFAVLLGGRIAAAAESSPESLPEGEGREQTFYACTACHGFALVAQQGMTRERWDETLTLMVVRNNMPPLDEEERARVLDYLAKAFPPRRRGRPSPFLR
jgi:mono/diheme cytochrome c family protein